MSGTGSLINAIVKSHLGQCFLCREHVFRRYAILWLFLRWRGHFWWIASLCRICNRTWRTLATALTIKKVPPLSSHQQPYQLFLQKYIYNILTAKYCQNFLITDKKSCASYVMAWVAKVAARSQSKRNFVHVIWPDTKIGRCSRNTTHQGRWTKLSQAVRPYSPSRGRLWYLNIKGFQSLHQKSSLHWKLEI